MRYCSQRQQRSVSVLASLQAATSTIAITITIETLHPPARSTVTSTEAAPVIDRPPLAMPAKKIWRTMPRPNRLHRRARPSHRTFGEDTPGP